jgi:hypothetical protein
MAVLTDADIKRPSQREYITSLEDTDVFVVEDVSEQKIKPITKTNAKATLGITDAEGTLAYHESRLDSTELTLARTNQDLASVKQTLQQGNGATLDFEDIGIVPLDARATGRANPTVEGRTVTNIVDGAGIANLGTVTFASVFNYKYFDVLHGTILTGTGSDMTVTNDTGATKDIAVINLTATYGAGNEPTASDCAKIFSYFDGTKSIQLPARIISKSEDESEASTLYIADNEEVRSVPAISDEVKVVNGQLVKVQNVERYVLQESDIYSIVFPPDWLTSIVYISYNNLSPCNGLYGYSSSNAGNNRTTSRTTPKLSRDRTSLSAEWTHYDGLNYFEIITPRNQYASLAEAQADLAGTVIYYQLATPIITPLLTSGILQAKPNGTVYYEPYYEGSHQTDASSQITLPYEGTIDKVTGYDENLEPYEVPSTGYTLVGTTLTITGATENEVYYVELSRTEPLAPELTVNTLNNEQVTLDSADGKYYQIGFTTTNGVPTVTATEVL